jgi:hypothetical protein
MTGRLSNRHALCSVVAPWYISFRLSVSPYDIGSEFEGDYDDEGEDDDDADKLMAWCVSF